MDADRPDSPVNSTENLGAFLRKLVVNAENNLGRGIDRAGLARRIRVSRSSLYAYLNGTTLIPAEILFRLLRELGVDEQHAHRARQVREQLAQLPSVAVPQWLPLDIDPFAGRAEHLAELDRLRSHSRKAGTVVITAVSGTGGIGKTALAVRWAHSRHLRFPDGCLYLDLRGFRPDMPLQPDEALATMLRRLGLSSMAIPVALEERVERYQSLLAGKRMLILLDNAYSTEQVIPLLPPGSSSCFVIVTSRDRLTSLVTIHGARPLGVDALPEPEAHSLLAGRLGDERLQAEAPAADEIVAHCAGLPLALSIVAGRAEAHPDFPLSAMAEGLRDDAHRLAALDDGEAESSLRSILSWSYRNLDDEQARVFKLLGLAPGPDISVTAVINLTGFPSLQANEFLRDLECASLIQQHTPGRYRLHDLVRLYASEQARRDLPLDMRITALRRLMSFYIQTAYIGDKLLHPHRDPINLESPSPGSVLDSISDVTAALRWFDIEHPCLLAVHQYAAANGWNTAAWQLAWVLDTFHFRQGHVQTRVACWRAGLAAAERLNDQATHSLAHRRLGGAYAWAGMHAQARDHLKHALALAEHIRDARGQAETHRDLAWACEQEGDDRRALAHATRALSLYQDLEIPVREAEALNAVGWFSARLGDHDQGREACERALVLTRQHNDIDNEAETLDSLGYIADCTGRHAQAIDYYLRAVALYHDLGNSYEEANTLARLGDAFANCSQHKESREAWRQALDLYRIQHRIADASQVKKKLDSHIYLPGAT